MFNDPKYCIELKLTQQTPMIHFQAREGMSAGLGPRATEVKPKLDRFAALWYKRHNDKDLPDEWMVEFDEERKKKGKKPEHSALNYVLRITASSKEPVVQKPDNNVKSVYFGNMGENTAKKLQIFNTGPVSLYIRCFIPGLKKLLEDCIETFFLIHNFGMRQDKGLGGFIPEGMTPGKAEDLLRAWIGKDAVMVIDYSGCDLSQVGSADGGLLIGEIGTIYRILKSGLNIANRDQKGPYIKSALTEYFLQEGGISGEKRAMKARGVAPHVYTRGDKSTHTQGGKNGDRYIRGLFGYGQLQKWFSADQNDHMIPKIDEETGRIKKNKNRNIEYEKDTIKISPSKGTGIERIPSPLLFKIVGKCVFIIPHEIKVHGKLFEFSSIRYDRTIPAEPFQLEIPSEEEFNINDFMRWFIDWLDNKRRTVTYLPPYIPHIFTDSNVVIRQL